MYGMEYGAGRQSALRNPLKLMLFMALLLPLFSSAEIYRWVDENGKIHLSDSPPEEADVEQVDVEVNTYESIDYSKIQYYQPEEKPARKRVIMYATSWCGYCAKARAYFQKKDIRYREYDIDADKTARQKFESYGGSGVPLILVGKQTMRGFSVGRFERLYSGNQ